MDYPKSQVKSFIMASVSGSRGLSRKELYSLFIEQQVVRSYTMGIGSMYGARPYKFDRQDSSLRPLVLQANRTALRPEQ